MNESDPRSNVHYLGSNENKTWKKIQACTGFFLKKWIFFRPYFHYCLSSAHYCEDHFQSVESSVRSILIFFFDWVFSGFIVTLFLGPLLYVYSSKLRIDLSILIPEGLTLVSTIINNLKWFKHVLPFQRVSNLGSSLTPLLRNPHILLLSSHSDFGHGFWRNLSESERKWQIKSIN